MPGGHGARVAGTGVDADEVFRVETHGTEHIDTSDRHGGPRDLFWVWFGANLTFTHVVNGALIVTFGLPTWQALAVVVLGNLCYLLVGLGGVAGARTGSPTLVVARAAFGWLGNYPAAVINWVVSIGYIVLNTLVGVFALEALAAVVGVAGTPVRWASLVVMTAGTATVAVWGHATVQVTQRWLAYGLAVCSVLLCVMVLPSMDLTAVAAAQPSGTGGFAGWTLATVVIVSAPLSYVALCADYTRYLPGGSSVRGVTWSATLGAAVPTVALAVVGVVAATRADMADPVAGLNALLPHWFQVPFLLVVVGGSMTNTVITLYSSGLNLQVLGVPMARAGTVLVQVALVTAGSAVILFVTDFSEALQSFVSIMTIVFAPWSGVFLADMWLRRSHYDVAGLHRFGAGPYWYTRGLSVPGLGALALGIAFSLLTADSELWTGPLVTVTGGDLSLLGGAVAALAYAALTGASRRPTPAPAPHP